MADEVDTLRATVIASMVVVLAGVAYLELRMIRSRRRKKSDQIEMPDRAHNALLSTKAIADALARGGVRSTEADALIVEAETAMANRNFRVATDLLDRAKSVLRNEKARQGAKGDLAKLEVSKPPADAEPTTKEKLTRELPTNFVQAKFSMNLAQEAIDAARGRGLDVAEAERTLAEARRTFDATDYTAALAQSSRARRMAETSEGAPAPVASTPPKSSPPRAPAKTRGCPSCGAVVALDDAFCRKCGTKVPRSRACPSCGAEVAPEDAFCRKCGTKAP